MLQNRTKQQQQRMQREKVAILAYTATRQRALEGELAEASALIAQKASELQRSTFTNQAGAAVLKADIADLQDDLALVQRELRQAQEERAELQRHCDEVDKELNETRELLREANEVNDSLRREVEFLTSKLQASEAKLFETTVALEESNARAENLEGQLLVASGLAIVSIGALGILGIHQLFKREGDPVALGLSDIDVTKFKVVVENQRWYPMSKWSSTLLPTDRPAFTATDPTVASHPPTDSYALADHESWVPGKQWSVFDIPTSRDGWIYALDFPRQFYTEVFSTAFVRKRIHMREFDFSPAGPPREASTLNVGETVWQNLSLRSPSGRYAFRVQEDGNVVLTDGEQPLWASATQGAGIQPFRLTLDPDNHLVSRDVLNAVRWSSGVQGKGAPGGRLTLQDDGNLVVYDAQGNALWCTRTDGPQRSPYWGTGHRLA